MPRMLELIRASAVPATLMQSAAKGALSVPPQEMLEILVHLATHNKVFAKQAGMTLAGWDQSLARNAAANPATSKEVLDYLIDTHNLRPALLPILLENPSVGVGVLTSLAAGATREQVEILLTSPRVNGSLEVMNALSSNPNVKDTETAHVRARVSSLAVLAAAEEAETPPSADQDGDVPDEIVSAYLSEHAAEIAAEPNKPFQPLGGVHEELAHDPEPPPLAMAAAASASGSAQSEAIAHRVPLKKAVLSADEKRGSALQKVAKLDIKGRIQLAMKGNKEERSLLVRDGTKIVALAVLDSPKLGDGEVEKFASQRNVLEAVLRAIPMKRRFMKMYPVVRNLSFNPRTPIDVSLGLLKNLLIKDLRNLSGNKEVSDTIRKLATKMFRQKLDVSKKDV